MKTTLKIFTLGCLLIVLSSCCISKGPCKPIYSVVGGANFSNISQENQYDDGFEDNSSRLGVQVGARAFLPINPNFALESGLGFATKGSKSGFDYGGDGGEFGGEGFSSETSTNLSYLELPVLARYQFNNSGFNAFGGVQPALLLSAKQKFEETGQESQSQDVKDNFNNLDMAAVLGVGYQFNNGIMVNASYDLGMANIVADNVMGLGTRSNRSFKISLGYIFNPVRKPNVTNNNQ